MKKYYFAFVILFCYSVSSFAQSPTQRCASFTMLQNELQNDPAFLQQYMLDTAEINAYMIQHPYESLDDRSVITVPVVVHVVYNTTAQNISDAQVITQITAMNKDFQNWNSDTTSLPSIYHSVHGNPKVAFCLAHTTPTGAYTTGIEHIHTNTTSFSMNDAVKTAASGAIAWDRNNYLNIWVCNLGGGLLGYSTFPGGTASKDGCVILYQAFGTTGSLISQYNLGRTVTHEVGHWFALYHIWGDDGTSCSGTDQISDTPNQADENYGCPSGANSSCGNSGDMSMNYMDYTDDACMYMFTKNQAVKINAVLSNASQRLSIKSSTKCNTPSDIEVNELYILFGISPNPSTGIINLYAEYPSYKNLSVEVYNVTGQQVYSNHFYMGGVDVQSIDLSNLVNGIYLVKISDGKNNLTKQIILQK